MPSLDLPWPSRPAQRAPRAALALLGCALLLSAALPAGALKPVPENPTDPPIAVLRPLPPPVPGVGAEGVTDRPYGLVAISLLDVVQLMWFGPHGASDGYRVYRSGGLGVEGQLVAELPAGHNGWIDYDCPFLTTCVYAVSAFDVTCHWFGCQEEETARSHEAVAVGSPRALLDADGDGHTDDAELDGNSNPADPGSGPASDDNCDGRPNHQEENLLESQGWLPGADVNATQGFDPVAWEGDLRVPTVRIRMEACA